MKKTHTVMSKKLRELIGNDPEYARCALQGYEEQFGVCDGRVTREHAAMFAGKKVQEWWAIIPCCAKHHGVDQFQDAGTHAPKTVRLWVALNRATDEDLSVYRKAGFKERRKVLNRVYGEYIAPPIENSLSINY